MKKLLPLLLLAVPLWQVEMAVKVGIATIRKPAPIVQSPPSQKCESGKCPTPQQSPGQTVIRTK
jgi:hypothetical protein